MHSENSSPFANRRSLLVPAPILTSLSNLSLLSPQLKHNNTTTTTTTTASAPPIPISIPPLPKRHSSLSGPSGAKAFLMAMGMTSPAGIQEQPQSQQNSSASLSWFSTSPAAQGSNLPFSRTGSWNTVNSGKLTRQKSTSYNSSSGIPFTIARKNSITESCHSSQSSQTQSPAASFLSNFTERSSPRFSPADEEGEEVGGYVLGKVLGRGMFSVVRKAFTMRGQLDKINVVAVKIIKNESDTADSENSIPTAGSTTTSNAGQDAAVNGSSSSQSLSETRLDREIDIWRQLEHPHLLRMIEVVEHPQTTFIFCDFCPGGDMLTYLRRKGNLGLPESEAARLWAQLASAVLYLHEILRVVHRDIKLENILLNEVGDVKLGDFGFADYVHHTHRLVANPAMMGSLAYCAPELVRPQKATSSAVPSTSIPTKLRAGDSWALGVILFAFVTGSLPFADEFEPRMILKISNVQYAWSSSSSSSSSTNSTCALSPSGTNTASCSSSETSPLACVFPSPSLEPLPVIYFIEPPSTPLTPSTPTRQSASSSPLTRSFSRSSPLLPSPSSAASSFSSSYLSGSFSFSSAPSPGPALVDAHSSRTDAKSMGSPLVRSLVAGLLNAKWRDRWTVRMALDSPWVKSL